MRIIQAVFFYTCVVCTCTIVEAKSYDVSLVLTSYFDTYGDLPWEDEQVHLDNFAIALQHDPTLIGYIIVYAGRRACAGEAKHHAIRARRYLIGVRGIQNNRVRYINGGYREKFTVILQPILRGAPALTASPTLRSSEVQIIKNCKSKNP